MDKYIKAEVRFFNKDGEEEKNLRVTIANPQITNISAEDASVSLRSKGNENLGFTMQLGTDEG